MAWQKPLFLVQQDPLELWPSLIFCALFFILRWVVNIALTPIARYLTDYKLEHEKPDFLITSDAIRQDNIRNGTFKPSKQNNQEVSASERKQILSLIEDRDQSSESKLYAYISTLQLSGAQQREIRSYVQLCKEYDTHNNKFLESTFKLLAIVPIAVYGTWVVYFKHDFFFHPWKQWINFGDDLQRWDACHPQLKDEPLTQVYDAAMYWYYVVSLGYHLNRALGQFHNPSRKDFLALLIHHWTTLGLMLCSWMGGKTRSGCIILAIHESSDIFLESAKICGYCSLYWLADFFFILFFLSWVVLRLYSFCYRLLFTIYHCGYKHFWMGDHPLIYPYVCVSMLYVLECLHIYWFRLIMKIVINKIVGKRIADIRSGEDSDSDTKHVDGGKKQN